jgi:hypothetical protein
MNNIFFINLYHLVFKPKTPHYLRAHLADIPCEIDRAKK